MIVSLFHSKFCYNIVVVFLLYSMVLVGNHFLDVKMSLFMLVFFMFNIHLQFGQQNIILDNLYMNTFYLYFRYLRREESMKVRNYFTFSVGITINCLFSHKNLHYILSISYYAYHNLPDFILYQDLVRCINFVNKFISRKFKSNIQI